MNISDQHRQMCQEKLLWNSKVWSEQNIISPRGSKRNSMLICKSLVEEKKIHYLKDLEILPVCVQMNSFKSLQEKKRVILRQEMKSVLASPTNLLGVRPALSSPFPPVLRTIQLEASDRHRGELTAGIYTVGHDHSYFQHLTLKNPAHFLVGT